jgi:hypothetical protein
MSIQGRSETWMTWFGSPPPDCLNERRYAEWRANYDEARGIARYFRYMAESRAKPGIRRTEGRT